MIPITKNPLDITIQGLADRAPLDEANAFLQDLGRLSDGTLRTGSGTSLLSRSRRRGSLSASRGMRRKRRNQVRNGRRRKSTPRKLSTRRHRMRRRRRKGQAIPEFSGNRNTNFVVPLTFYQYALSTGQEGSFAYRTFSRKPWYGQAGKLPCLIQILGRAFAIPPDQDTRNCRNGTATGVQKRS